MSAIPVGNEVTRIGDGECGDDEIFGRNYRGGDKVDEISGNFCGSATKISEEAKFALAVLKIRNAGTLEAPTGSAMQRRRPARQSQ